MKKFSRIKISVGNVKVGLLAKKLIVRTLLKNRLTYGDLTIRFENEFAKLHGCRFGLFTVSGTAALQVALHALKSLHGWRDGDEVIVPAVTFVATSNIVLENNLKPVFVDINYRTYNIDTALIEKKITKKTRAIIPVHLFGQPAKMDKIMSIAKRYHLKVLADSCETMLVRYKGRSVGEWGDIVCFSTYAAHLLVTGVGGLMLTNNSAYATKMRSLMNHGRDTIYYNIDQDDNVSTRKALFTLVDRRFSFVDIGYSYRLTEMEAALGIEGLGRLKADIRTRQSNAKYLIENLGEFDNHLQLPAVADGAGHAYMMFPIVIRSSSNVKRSVLVTFLESRGIETRYMMPLLNQPVYRKLFGDIERKYPVARWVNRNGFYIGCHQDLSRTDLGYIVKVFHAFFRDR